MKQAIQRLINHIRCWRNAVVVEWYQEGNTVRVRTQCYGFFKQYGGIPLLCDIDIDPTQITQSDEWNAGTIHSEEKFVMKRAVQLFINRIQLWRGRVASIIGWYRYGNTIYLKIRRCGLFKQYKGSPITCDISIDPALITQSPK